MGKRKVYVKTDLSIPEVKRGIDQKGNTVALPQVIPPPITRVAFGRNATRMRFFDFSHWYCAGIDSITYACQKQIERFLAGQDSEIEVSTVAGYCNTSLREFLDYLVLRATAFQRELSLIDIDRDLIDGFLGHLAGQGVSINTQRLRYAGMKSVLQALGRRGFFTLVASGDAATFPSNPFPNSNRQAKGEVPLPKVQRQAFATAVKLAVLPIWQDDIPLTSELVSYALLIVALHTGRNTTPLLEMERDCLQNHPKDNSTFLVLWKRRGHNTSKVILRANSPHERLLESTPTIKTNIELLIRRVIAHSELICMEAPDDIQTRVWLYRSRARHEKGQVKALSENQLRGAIRKLVDDYGLTDSDGQPLRLNISRLRKTFANRVIELLDGDLATTAIALGNSPQIAGRNYLMPGEDAKRNWRFMGEVLVEELLNSTIGATYHTTPMGRCSDPVNGQYAPKREGATCINFINCVRCRHYAVTGCDLNKLFSFYYRVYAERSRMDTRRWAREYAHIPRLIDDYIVAEGLRRGVFKLADVNAAREHARSEPHPFWSSDLVSSLEVFT
ncbi:hypothetical protein [Pseudomonas fluorescens]|uniref:Core-binding (CB) domain-containing protein n=1 Tax=Pseudomonas fluorescens TaxID=294 RepID=A0A5E7FN12_PSEFL|nr:hypothetical protein [Pseudomonas fluorescens]VVO40605.1 hypothetical protein PS833_05785 [Pseudomonas fluorescens]